VKFFLKCRNHPIKCYQCVMHSQGRAGAQNAQWTHRWDSGSRVVLGSDRDNKGGWKCWSAQVAIMAMISTPSWNRPPLSVGRQLYLGFFLGVTRYVRAHKGERCQRKSHKGKANWSLLLLLLLLLFHHPVERRTATGGCHLYTILALAPILPSVACLTLEILMRCINYSYKVPSQIK